jgi:ubiquinone/menaquinone biosynthesis C-methylase UbiE
MKLDSRVPLGEKQFTDAGTARFYDEHARRFMGIIYRHFSDYIGKHEFGGKRVLDIGTGTGLLALSLAKDHPDWQVTGIDISEEMLALARETAARNGLSATTVFQRSSAEALPFPDGCYDLVVSNASLHLWKEPVKVFDEMARVTAPGGYCLVWDNLRLTILHPFLGLLGGVMGMNTAQRQLWKKAVRSAYTPGEVRAILKRSVMKDARVKVHPLLLELATEWKKH